MLTSGIDSIIPPPYLCDTPLAFPALTIDPGQHLVVFASGKDRKPASLRLERDLHLPQDGTFIVDIPPGAYEITLTMGDDLEVRDNMAIYVQGKHFDC